MIRFLFKKVIERGTKDTFIVIGLWLILNCTRESPMIIKDPFQKESYTKL